MEIKLIVKKIEDKEILFIDNKNKEISLPKYFLDNNIKVGEILYFSLNKNRAKDILNEILNP